MINTDRVKLEYVKSDGTRVNFTNLVKTITWSGDINSCARKLEFEILYSKHKNVAKIDIPLSGLIIFYENNIELFRGFVFDREKNNNSISFVAFDYGERLNKIKVSYNIKSLNANQISKKFFEDYKLKIGTLAAASTKIKKIFIGVSAYELIMSSYYEESKNNSKKYMIRAIKDTFNVVEKGNTTLKIAFEEGKNLLNSSYKESISNMINQVIIVDEGGNKKNVVDDKDLLKVHGLFQEVYKIEEGKDSIKEAKAMLKGIEQSATLEGFGDTTCITGNGVQVKDTATGLVGLFWIDSDTHTWEGNNYKISLDLNFKNIMAEVEVGEEESEKSSSGSSKSTGGNSDLVSIAKKYLGVPYIWGGTSPKGFDCSGFAQYVHNQKGISIPRTSSQQSQSGESVSKSNLQSGDLVFFSTNGTGKVSHVGMYIGNNQMIHAPSPGQVVKIESINSSYFASKYINARRYY